MRNFIRTIFYILTFFSYSSTLSFTLASTKTEVSLGLVEFDGYTGTYKGCKVNFEVFTGNDNQRDRIWCGQLRFSPPISVGKLNARTHYDPLIKLEYITDSVNYNHSFGSAVPLLTQSDDDFTYESIKKSRTERDILQSNLVTWRLDLPIGIQDVIDTVNGLKDSSGNFPKYKFVGYDWYNNVANCVTFSCRFLKQFGVDIDSCQDLSQWVNYKDNSGFFNGISFVSYYTIGLGWARDNIQSQYAVQQINNNKGSAVWRKSGQTSSAPQFAKKTIKNAFGEGFEKNIQ